MKQAVRVQHDHSRAGQALLIAVLSLGGAILAATTVAGLLTLYQIRATTDTANSAKAIFAADAGTEWAEFSFYCAGEARCSGLPAAPAFASPQVTATINCYDNLGTTGAAIPCNSVNTAAAISSGIANGTERAFFIGISTSSPAYP